MASQRGRKGNAKMPMKKKTIRFPQEERSLVLLSRRKRENCASLGGYIGTENAKKAKGPLNA